MKSRSESEWLKSYSGIHQELTSKWFKHKLQTLDNEASAALKIHFTKMTWNFSWFPCTVTDATQRSGAHHQNFQEKNCRRPCISGPSFPIVFFGSPFAATRNDPEFTTHIQAVSILFCSSTFSWPDRL
jgi:hypothetical protein